MTTIFLSFIGDLVRANIALDGTFKMMLVTEGYIPDETGHTRRSDVTDEAYGDGYTEGGVAVILTAIDDVDNSRVKIRIEQTEFSNVTIGARGCVVYRARGGDAANDELVCYGDFGSTVDVEAGPFIVEASDMILAIGS